MLSRSANFLSAAAPFIRRLKACLWVDAKRIGGKGGKAWKKREIGSFQKAGHREEENGVCHPP